MKRYKIMYGLCIVLVITTAVFLICSVLPRSMGYLGARNLYETFNYLGGYGFMVGGAALTPELYFVAEILILDRLRAAATGKKPMITLVKENDSMPKIALRLVCFAVVVGAFVCGFNYLREYTWFI